MHTDNFYKINKALLFFLLSIIMIFISCTTQEVVDPETLKRPEFDYEKTLVLRQHPVDFIDYFNVWKYAVLDQQGTYRLLKY